MRPSMLSSRHVALSALTLLAGCTGTIDDAPAGPGGPGGPLNPRDPSVSCEVATVGPSPLRRLTHTEYDNAVASLLGTTSAPARSFVPDPEHGLFETDASVQTVSPLLAEQYLEGAVTLAEGVSDVAALVGCDVSEESCVRGFVERFGRRVYRRPLEASEVESYVAIYTGTTAESDAVTGVRGVVVAFLVSPHFLFRPEFGGATAETGLRLANGYERATRLASLMWASIPDDALLDAAAAGELDSPEGVDSWARRMLEDPRSRPAVSAFYEQWLGLRRIETTTKLDTVFPEYDDELRDSMAEETHRFIEHVLWEDDARLDTLLTARFSFVNAPLADLYGLADGPADADTFLRMELDPTQRAGILTQASVLASNARPDESSPIKRGQWVRVRVLCTDLPPPPAVVPSLPMIEEGVSTRDRFAMHTADAACSSCHSLIDGLGFGLEAYDGIGRFRSSDRGVDVDASGEVTATRDADGAFEGGVELAERLAASEQVQDCAATQWFRYQLGRREGRDDLCSLRSVQESFDASEGNLHELMLALVQTDAFLYYGEAR